MPFNQREGLILKDYSEDSFKSFDDIERKWRSLQYFNKLMLFGSYEMTKQEQKKNKNKYNLRELRKRYSPSDISSDNEYDDIRKYFIDKQIEIIEYLSARLWTGNVKNKETENVRINQAKAIVNACNVGNRILKDFEYDKILKEVNELKNAVLYDSDGVEVIEIAPEKFDAIDDLDSKIAKLEENEWSE